MKKRELEKLRADVGRRIDALAPLVLDHDRADLQLITREFTVLQDLWCIMEELEQIESGDHPLRFGRVA